MRWHFITSVLDGTKDALARTKGNPRPQRNSNRGDDQSFAIICTRRVGTLSFISDRLGVERLMILEAECVILMSLFLLLMVNIVKRQGIHGLNSAPYSPFFDYSQC